MNAKFLYDYNKNTKFIGFVSAIIASVIMGYFGVFVRNTSVDEVLIALSRFALGFIFLAIYLLAGKQWRTFKVNIFRSLFSAASFWRCVFFFTANPLKNNFPIVGRLVGMFFETMAKPINALRVFEFDSGSGYSANWFVRALGPVGLVLCCDGYAISRSKTEQYLGQGRLWENINFEVGFAQKE